MRFRRLLLLCCAVLCTFNLFAQSTQPATGSVNGMVLHAISGDTRGGMRLVSGAKIMLIAGNDTINGTTMNGAFMFRRVAVGPATIEVKLFGYKTETKEIEVKKGQTTQQNFTLKEAPPEEQKIEEVVVKATVPPMTKDGDTLVYNPAAVKTLKDDAAEEILKQMPGVEIADGAVTVLGKNVEKVYVDGRLLFGDGVMTALQNLKASDVLKIKSFDERSEESQRSGRKIDDKRRVINIETRSKLVSATTGHMLGSIGADFTRNEQNKRQERYAAGVTLNYFSDSWDMNFTGLANNINRSSNRMQDILAIDASSPSYRRDNTIKFEARHKWKAKIPEKDTIKYDRPFVNNLNMEYTYRDGYSRSASISDQRYFPSTKFDSMINFDTTRNVNTSASHQIDLNFRNDYRGIRVSSRNNFWERGAEAYRGSENIFMQADVTTRSIGSNTTNNDSYGIDLRESANWYHKNFSVGGEFSFSQNDGNGWRVDTLVSNPTDQKIWLNNGAYGYSRGINANVSKGFNIINKEQEGLFAHAHYSYAYNKTLTQQTAIDRYTGLVDELNTSDYFSSTNTHTLGTSMHYYVRNRVSASVNVSYQSQGINRDERFPEDYVYDRRFDGVTSYVNFNLGPWMGNQFNIGYNTNFSAPSISQLRPRLNDSNKMRLSVGNPDLDQSRRHSINTGYKWLNSEKGRESRVDANFNITQNGILSRTTVFAQDTYLPVWDYEASQGSSLQTWENISGQMGMSGSYNHTRYLTKLKTKLNTSLRMNYSKTPSYVDDELVKTQTYAPTYRLGFDGNVSRKLEFNLSYNATYRYTENNNKDDDESLNQGVNTGFRWNITDWFFLNASFNYSHYTAYSGYSTNNDSQLLNAVAGFKLFKSRCDLAFTAYDILGKDSNFSSTVNAESTTNTWRQTFGRFFLVNVGYRINSVKSKTPPAPEHRGMIIMH